MELFCLEHILFMVVIALIMGLSIFLILKFVPKEKMFIPIKILATIGLILIIINRIVVAKSRTSTFIDFLPDTYCSMMGFIMPLVVLFFKPNTKIFQYALFAGMIGGLLTYIYPDFIVYFDTMFNIHPFTAYLYHVFMLFIFLIAIISKYFVPTFKNWISLPIGLAFMVVVGVFGNSVLNQSNNMYLNAPLIDGTFFTWYIVGILFLVLYTLIIQIYEMCTIEPKEWTVVKGWNCVISKFKEIKFKTNIDKRKALKDEIQNNTENKKVDNVEILASSLDGKEDIKDKKTKKVKNKKQ